MKCEEQKPKLGRPPQPLATRLAHKTTAKDPTNFDDDEHWFPVLRHMRSFGRSTTTARGIFEAFLGRKLLCRQLEHLERGCNGIRITDGQLTYCCNPRHQLLVSLGTPQSFYQPALEPEPGPEPEPEPEISEPEAPEPEPELELELELELVIPHFDHPTQSEDEEIADILDSLDYFGPAWRLDYATMMTKHIDLYDERLIREALKRYGVKEPCAKSQAN